eukprot:TRINITY_DN87929_c0_g1_i1.p1 TRINITY_DN87929_c0_g1~~TRINITY_DN87929_c0_g1_i1.p1  ORF type:complete len:555 (-),score=79.71 TRINITY_DN87929_c0_g1_i1:97-1761(-)
MDESAASVQVQRSAAQLCSFLRGRCGSIKAAFAALDRHNRGQVSCDDFKHGLRELGFIEDASSVFQALDAAGTGQVSFQMFATGILADCAHMLEEKTSSTAPLRSCLAQSPLKSAGTPRRQSDGQMLPPTLLSRPPMPVGAYPPHLKKTDGLTPKNMGLSRSGSANSGIKISSSLEARVVHLEDQLSFEQSQRLETELRLTQYLHAAIAEEFDALKKHFAEEQGHRLALKTELQTLRSKLNGTSLIETQDVANQLRKLEGKIDGFISDCQAKSQGLVPRHRQSWSGSTSASYDDGTDSQHPSSANGHERAEGPGAQHESITSSTMLRQENLSLREQNLRLREKVVEAMERERMCAVAIEKETTYLRQEQLRQQKVQELSKASMNEGLNPPPHKILTSGHNHKSNTELAVQRRRAPCCGKVSETLLHCLAPSHRAPHHQQHCNHRLVIIHDHLLLLCEGSTLQLPAALDMLLLPTKVAALAPPPTGRVCSLLLSGLATGTGKVLGQGAAAPHRSDPKIEVGHFPGRPVDGQRGRFGQCRCMMELALSMTAFHFQS